MKEENKMLSKMVCVTYYNLGSYLWLEKQVRESCYVFLFLQSL